MNLITKKLRDVTPEEFRKWKNTNCCGSSLNCSECPFDKVNCGIGNDDCWALNKDMYSDKFLDKIILVEAPEILDKEEKEYLSAVIKPFRHKIVYIVKMLDPFRNKEKIVFYYRNCYNSIKCFELPEFTSELMYKNMRTAQPYKLEELGL